MKNYLFIICALVITKTTVAQLTYSKSEIIAACGYGYKNGVADDGAPYISYDSTMYTIASGTYTRITAYYFDKDNKCKTVMFIEPVGEINAWIKYLNSEYVKLSELRWKDYAKNIIWVVKNRNGEAVTVSKFYDE